MTYDAKVPSKLKKTQIWFGSVIGRPIDEDSRMNPISPSGNPMEIEACQYINPSPTLRPAQRIQIYNQQYWWRLLSTLHDTFPVLTRLFGYHDFNRTLAIPYLVKYPPHHWSLGLLGSHFSKWIEEEYHADDRALILDAARLDWAFNYSFIVEQNEPILLSTLPKAGDPSSLFGHRLYLQPHICFFEFNYDLINFRIEFLKQEPDYWIDNDFPKLKKEKTYFCILYRNHQNYITWKEMTAAEFRLLKQFQKGTTIDEACEWIEKQGCSYL